MSLAKRSGEVEDRKKKWTGLVKAVAAADGLELRIGVMNAKIRYPKDRGGTHVARVAGIQQIYSAISEAYDAKRATIERGFEALHEHLIAGKPGIADFIYRRMGVPVRDLMREKAMQIVHRDTGRMEAAIRATVFENVKLGRKGAMHAGEVAAGDDPLRPKASEAIG